MAAPTKVRLARTALNSTEQYGPSQPLSRSISVVEQMSLADAKR